MALFRHALQVCTIACITISIHGHVLFAVNVEDFRNLANQFLTKKVAAQLSQLVSAGANRRDDTTSGKQDAVPDINKVVELIRDRLLNEYRAPVTSAEKVTRKSNIKKRFSTVQNTVDDERPTFTSKIRNTNYETTSAGLVYVKDDLEKLLQIKTDDTNSDRSELHYAGARLDKSEEKTLPREPTNSKESFDVKRDEHAEKQREVPIKIDYTETKLGEWLFNHILSQKPTKIQNHKISNSDINDEGSTEEAPNESENKRKVQYVYETQTLGRNDKIKQTVQDVPALRPKNKDTHDVNIQDQLTGEHGTIKEHDMRPKLTPQKQLTDENYTGSQTKNHEIDKKIVMDEHRYVKPIQGNENTFNHRNIAFDQDEGRMPASLEAIKPESTKAKIESSLHDTVEGKHQPLEEHITYDKYILGSKGKDDHLKEPQRQAVGENDMYGNGELAEQTHSSNNNRLDPQQEDDSEDKLIQETNKIFNDERIASIRNEVDRSSYQDQLLLRNKKGHSVIKRQKNQQYLSDYKEVKSDSVKSKIEGLLDDTVESKDQQEGSHIKFTKENDRIKKQSKPIEENDVYEKYELGADTKSNGKVKPQPDDDYVSKRPIPGMKYEFDHDNVNIKDDDFYNKDKSVFGNTERDSSVKFAKHGVSTTKVQKKKEKDDEHFLPAFQAVKLGSSSSDEIKDKKTEEHDTSKNYNFEKYDESYKPKKQPIEENDIYKTYSLGSEDKVSKDKEVKNDNNKYGFEETVFEKKNKRDHPVRDEDDETNMYKKHSLENNSNREVKRDYNKYGYKEQDFIKNNEETVLRKKDKGDHRGFGKDEESEMHDKYSLSTKYKNSRDREDDEIDDDKHGYKETVSGKKTNGDHRVRNKEKENDMHDKYSLSTKFKYSRDREDDEIDDDKHGYKETVSGKKTNGDHRVRNKEKENDMHAKYSLSTKNKYSRDREDDEIDDDKHGYKETVSGKKTNGDHRVRNKEKENDMHDKYSLSTKYKYSRDREDDEIDDDKHGYKETVSGKKTNGDHRVRNKEKENDMYDKYSLGSKDKKRKDKKIENDDGKYGYKEPVTGKKKDANDDEENGMYKKYILGSKVKTGDKHGYKETPMGNKNKENHRQLDKEDENNMYDKFSQGSKDKNMDGGVDNDNDKYGYKKTFSEKNNNGKQGIRNKDEENGTYDKYSLGSKDKRKDRNKNKEDKNNMYDKYSQGSKDKKSNTEVEKRDNNNYSFKDTVLVKETRGQGRDKDAGNKDELLLKNKNRYVMKTSKDPSEGYAGDPRPDFKEVKPESIKAKTEKLLDSIEKKGKPTRHFTMKGTLIPKRQFYKLSSPNYYKDLPRVVDKYDFDEPLPERDRQRDESRYLKREPSRVNRKLKLPTFEKVKI